MSGYGQFCAIARALEVLDERWTLLIVREFLLGATSFTDIRRGLPRIPRGTLSTRLRHLRVAGIVEPHEGGYRLTEAGTSLAPILREMARWATFSGSANLSDDNLDTVALTWDIQRRVDVTALPGQKVVVAIEFTDRPVADRYFWLHLARTDINLCREDTGAPVDVWITAPTEDLTRWWLGQLSWAQFLRRPGVTIHGNRALQRGMPRWFRRYVFTPDVLNETTGS